MSLASSEIISTATKKLYHDSKNFGTRIAMENEPLSSKKTHAPIVYVVVKVLYSPYTSGREIRCIYFLFFVLSWTERTRCPGCWPHPFGLSSSYDQWNPHDCKIHCYTSRSYSQRGWWWHVGEKRGWSWLMLGNIIFSWQKHSILGATALSGSGYAEWGLIYEARFLSSLQ